MRSLRFRLTLAYAVPIAFALCIAFVAIAYLALQFLTRPVVEAVAASAARTRAVVAADHGEPLPELLDRIEKEAAMPHVRIVVRSRRIVPGPPPRSIVTVNLAAVLAIRPTFVPVRGDEVAIFPELRTLDRTVSSYLAGLAAALVLSLVVSWLIGRWITAHAIASLARVTEELQRFASGDFRPQTLMTRDRSELGALIAAYNGAAAQVAHAFREREQVERHMRRFVADASHELRTPLTAFRGFVEILERGGAEKAAVRDRAFETLNKETNRMNVLVEQLITLSRLESLEHVVPSEIDVRETVRDAIDSVHAARSGKIVLRRGDDAQTWGDPGGIYEAVVNLMDNAVKYGRGSDVLVDVIRQPAAVQVRVADSGPGIPEYERAHIFERFFRGDGRSGIDGSGLGLAIAARAAELAGGNIALESALPGNTVFVLTLPSSKGNRSERD